MYIRFNYLKVNHLLYTVISSCLYVYLLSWPWVIYTCQQGFNTKSSSLNMFLFIICNISKFYWQQGQEVRKQSKLRWMNQNKYTFYFTDLTDQIIQTPTQSFEITGPISETMTVHFWWPSHVLNPLPTHHPAHINYGTESLVRVSVQVKLSYSPTLPF